MPFRIVFNALTDKQLARFDRLLADKTREKRAIEKSPETVAQIQSDGAEGLELTIKEGYHSKRDIPLFIVQMSERVDRATYIELLGKCKMLGGWFSSFVKSQAGFQFNPASLRVANRVLRTLNIEESTAYRHLMILKVG